MKRILACGIGVLLSALINYSHAAQTAQATMFCLSLRFQQGVYQGMLGDVTLNLSTTDLDNPNGELAPTFDSPDHYSGFILYDTFFEEDVAAGSIDLDTPAFVDANDNGFDDFFEVSQAGAGTSTGRYTSPGGNGSLRATWSRAAGSKDGAYALEFGSGQTSLGNFQGTFELIEYAGPLSYTAGSSKVSGAVRLLQTGAVDNLLAGPIEFTKVPTNRFDELFLTNSVWTNASGQSFDISNEIDTFLRDLSLKTNYYGYVDFLDGDLNTADEDYYTWVLSIDDVNDSDGDGIPDFSDDPGAVRPPTVLLSIADTNLSFSISSTIGRTVEIQEVPSLGLTNWLTVSSFAPTNDPQVVLLPRPNGTRFWRLRNP